MIETGVPFNERGGALRGCLDLISGRFPRFVFGGRLGRDILPVFHFHEVSRESLEPQLRYLSENGYRSVTSDEIEGFVRGRSTGGDRLVGLCFDDAWASLWTVAAPLLRDHGLSAIAYAIPGRLEEARACRPQHAGNGQGVTGPPFVTWPELVSLQASGTIDVQSHTHTHSMVFCSAAIRGFVTPGYEGTPLLNRPQLTGPPQPRFLEPSDLGSPLYVTRSRMSDGLRAFPSPLVRARCVEHVAHAGGRAFFEQPDWRSRLEEVAAQASVPASWETAAERESSIEEELALSRETLNQRLNTNAVSHICLPWGVSGGTTAAALKRVGYHTAFANRLPGTHAVCRGDDPYWLKRLPNRYIYRLPGRGRRIFT